jgi:hypothetical protein
VQASGIPISLRRSQQKCSVQVLRYFIEFKNARIETWHFVKPGIKALAV